VGIRSHYFLILLLVPILFSISIPTTNFVFGDEYDVDRDNMQLCEKWYEQYKILTENEFYRVQSSPLARDCVLLYEDPIWDYQGSDRINKLIEKYREYKEMSMELGEVIREESQIEAQLSSATLGEKLLQGRVTELEEKMAFLEEEIAKKDAILMEQVKVIMDLVNKLTSTVYEKFISLFHF